MATKHTPGPWKVSTSLSGNTCVTTVDHQMIARVEWSGIRSEEQATVSANAQLLAAAPELLAALKQVKGLISENRSHSSMMSPEMIDIFVTVVNAIKKAESL